MKTKIVATCKNFDQITLDKPERQDKHQPKIILIKVLNIELNRHEWPQATWLHEEMLQSYMT